jgi:hypothetical protein
MAPANSTQLKLFTEKCFTRISGVINGGNTSAGHETISGNLKLNPTTETCERSKVTQTKAKKEYQKAAIESRALQKINLCKCSHAILCD